VTTCPHWDMHILGGVPMLAGWPLEYPYTLGQPGHEACGDIEAVGSEVTEVSVGQRVCAWRDQGHHRPGCYAQYAILDVENVIAVPRAIPPEHCASLELAMCISAHILYAEKLDAIAGQRIGVFGLGPAGLVCIQLLRAAGASEVIGFDPMPERREMALSFGAARAIDPSGGEAAAFPRRGQSGALHATFDCVGVPKAVHQAMELTNTLVILFAVQREPYIFAPQYWVGMALVGAQMHSRAAAEFAAAKLASGQLNLAPLVTRTMRLEDYGEAVGLLKNREAIKVAFMPQL
ncbi:MAG TPA: zinc-binding dehydrogenase, partial [bacterium]|nr:zinc-binding dehydrogenase [bacterium]